MAKGCDVLIVSEAILKTLKKIGVNDIFGVPSGTLASILDSFNDVDINYIVTKNEAAASFAAAKYARVAQKPGVVLLGGAVGVGNAINGISEATYSKYPVLIISGAPPRKYQPFGPIQGVESDKYVRGLVKYSKYVSDEKEIISELLKAYKISMEHPRGAVHIAIPVDLQKEEYTGVDASQINYLPNEIETDYKALDKAVDLINNTDKGILVLGGGCRGLTDDIERLLDKLNWRVVTTVSGKAILAGDHRLNMGNYGFASTDLANEYIEKSDAQCVIALGTSLGEASTKTFNRELINNRKLAQIDIDENAFNHAFDVDIKAVADLRDAVKYITDNIKKKDINNDITSSINSPYDPDSHTGVSMRRVCEEITSILPEDTFYVCDMGEFMNFAYKYLSIPRSGDFESNLNYGCMGSSMGAMGINRINKSRLTAVFIGDGSIWMNGLTELLTAKRYNMKIMYFIINNAKLSYVDRGHNFLYGRSLDEFCEERIEISSVTKAMDINSIKIQELNELEELRGLADDMNGPLVVEIVNDSSEPIPLDRMKSFKNG